jgi:hypothetical protein
VGQVSSGCIFSSTSEDDRLSLFFYILYLKVLPNRFILTPDGEPGLNYLCAGYKAFFIHIDEPLKMMVNLYKQGRDATEIMPKLAAKDRAKKKPVGFGKKV